MRSELTQVDSDRRHPRLHGAPCLDPWLAASTRKRVTHVRPALRRLTLLSALPAFLLGCGASPSRASPQQPLAFERIIGTVEWPQPATVSAVLRVSAARLFVADPACTLLEPGESLSSDASPESAVRAIVRCRALAELTLADPEVRVTESTAIVDLRVQSGRSLHDLSSCESLALLGAIRLTLRSNPRWGIHCVVFTDRGNLFAI